MKDKLKAAVITVAAIAALALGGTAIAGATGGGDDDDDKPDKPIAGQALDRAKTVALDHIGGGKVTATEVDDEEGAYEVEVTRADGSQVDVHLDRGFNVINQANDGEHGSGNDSDGESGNDD